MRFNSADGIGNSRWSLRFGRMLNWMLLFPAILGCSQQEKTDQVASTPSNQVASDARLKAESAEVAAPPGIAVKLPLEDRVAPVTAPFPELKVLGEDIDCVLVIHPRRIAESGIYRELKRGEFLENLVLSMASLDESDVERIVLGCGARMRDMLLESVRFDVARKQFRLQPLGKIDPTIKDEMRWVVTLTHPVDREAFIKSVFDQRYETVDYEGVVLRGKDLFWIGFLDDTTMLLGPLGAIKAMIAQGKMGTPNSSPAVASLDLNADLTAVFDLHHNSKRAKPKRPDPAQLLIQLVASLQLHVYVNGKPQDPLAQATFEFVDEETASTFAKGVNDPAENLTWLIRLAVVGKLKSLFPAEGPQSGEISELPYRFIDSSILKQAGNQINLTLFYPGGAEQFSKIIQAVCEHNEKTQDPRFSRTTAEGTLRSFMLGVAQSNEALIRKTIMPTSEEDLALLLRTETPPEDVRAFLANARIRELAPGDTVTLPGNKTVKVGADEVTKDRKVLLLSDMPVPTRLQRLNGQWRVDARPMIDVRKAMSKSKTKAPAASGEKR